MTKGLNVKDGSIDPNKLAVARTSLAYDRTLLAWVRTSIGIIGFGFSFYKFFEFLPKRIGFQPAFHTMGTREYAILLIACGNLTLFFASLDYFRARRQIRRLDPNALKSSVPLVATLVAAFGFLTLLAAILRF